jgi:NAD(P)-dependent dehydrogenase (short-subunit alcohol dehydrogenase family)
MGRLDGAYAVVTGAGAGIGRATALALAGEGAVVAALDLDPEAARATAVAIEAAGGKAVAGEVDVSDRAAVAAVFEALPFPEITVLVNNAGVREVVAFEDLALDDWDHVVATNLSGAFYCTKAAYPFLRRPGGSIVNVSSVAGIMGVPKRVAYSAAKHGLVGLTRGLADDLGAVGIRVNAICPGVTETPLTQGYFDDERLVGDLRRATPLRRWAAPEEIARAVAFLASDDAAFCTGSVLAVDGGYTATKGFG